MNKQLSYGMFYLMLCISLSAVVPVSAAGKKIHNRHYKFMINVPDDMQEKKDVNDSTNSELYYSGTAGITLYISARDSKFKSVDDYIDCRKAELERMLRNDYSDSTLHLINCSRSPYYPKKTTMLYFQAACYSAEGNMNVIYFIHHRRKDIQIYFTFSKKRESESLIYIETVMQTLKLR